MAKVKSEKPKDASDKKNKEFKKKKQTKYDIMSKFLENFNIFRDGLRNYLMFINGECTEEIEKMRTI
jgi:hypothetical protein